MAERVFISERPAEQAASLASKPPVGANTNLYNNVSSVCKAWSLNHTLGSCPEDAINKKATSMHADALLARLHSQSCRRYGQLVLEHQPMCGLQDHMQRVYHNEPWLCRPV